MSEIKVNKISPRAACGTVQLGDSGDTFTIPAGATINNQGTATNFGATGSASWNTTVKTGDFTAVAGEGYFVNTTSGEIDVTLPAGSPGAVVAVKDYANTWDTNNCIIISNGSEKIGGSTNNAILSTEGLAVTFIYIDSTQGWLVTDDGNQNVAVTNPFIVATGGTITTSGNCKIHTFTGPGTFAVSKIACVAANNEVSYLVVAGGAGAGGDEGAGGGGAGGFRETKSPVTPYTASPLDGQPSAPNRITVTATDFPISVGGGGAGGTANPDTKGTNGSNSIFSTIISAGGGGGGYGDAPGPDSNLHGLPGGSGGGSGGRIGSGCSAASKGTGNTPPVSPAQGFPGGAAKTCTSVTNDSGGGGGGALTAGSNASNPQGPGGAGGNGAATLINPATGQSSGCTQYYAGGGGGGCNTSNGGTSAGGLGGGASGRGSAGAGNAATTNTGGGGGGATKGWNGGAGGSGIVIIRYKFQ